MYQKAAIRGHGAAYCFATWDRVLIEIWRLAVSAEIVAERNRIARMFMLEERQPISSLSIIEPLSPPPSDSARAELATFSRDLVPKMGVAVIVAEGGGFRAALVRGVGITLTTLMPHRVPFKFVHDVQEATVILAQHLSPAAGGAAGLERAVHDLRAQITR
jgi:hypothetical protein